MKYGGIRTVGMAFILIPLTLGVILHFLAVIFGLGLTLRSVDFITFAIQNIAMALISIFGSIITLGFLMITSTLYRDGLVTDSKNSGMIIIDIILKLFWIFAILIDSYAIYITSLRFIVTNPNVLGSSAEYSQQTLPFTNFTINAQLNFSVIPVEQLITLTAIAIIVIFSPILLSYLREETGTE